jgi:hypothetical protein
MGAVPRMTIISEELIRKLEKEIAYYKAQVGGKWANGIVSGLRIAVTAVRDAEQERRQFIAAGRKPGSDRLCKGVRCE